MTLLRQLWVRVFSFHKKNYGSSYLHHFISHSRRLEFWHCWYVHTCDLSHKRLEVQTYIFTGTAHPNFAKSLCPSIFLKKHSYSVHREVKTSEQTFDIIIEWPLQEQQVSCHSLILWLCWKHIVSWSSDSFDIHLIYYTGYSRCHIRFMSKGECQPLSHNMTRCWQAS